MAHHGPRDNANAMLEHVLDASQRAGQLENADVYGLAPLLEAAIQVENRDAAVSLSKILAPCADFITFGLSAIARHLGAASALLGDRSQAERYYRQALDLSTRIGFRPEIALTRLDIAELLFDGTADERVQAQEHLAVAIPEFRAMHMQPALDRALQLQSAAKV